MGTFKRKPRSAYINWGHPLSRGLVECWFINENKGNTIFSLGINTKFTSNFTWCGNVIKFPGSGGTGNAVKKIPTNAFTVHTIVRPDTNASTKGIWDIGSGANVRLLSNYNGGVFGCDVYAVGPGPVSASGTYFVFNHVTLTGSATYGTKLYVDGKLGGSSGLFWGISDTSNSNLFLGSLREGFQSNQSIKLFLIYNRVLFPQEIYWLYREPYAFIKNVDKSYLGYVAPAVGGVNPYYRSLMGVGM